MATYYAQCPVLQTYSMPFIVSNHYSILNTVPSVYTAPIQHIPITFLSPQIITPVCPYAEALVQPESVQTIQNVSDVHTNVYNNLYNTYDALYTQELESYDQDQYKEEEIAVPEYTENEAVLPEQVQQSESVIDTTTDPVEFYLALPKELFPTAKMLDIDPNPIIDECCKIKNISENVPWILDVEFGTPRVPVTRAIAVYDVKFNSVHCKNTPNAIHPGFEKCSSDFKRIILFYYDLLVSMWYKGYIILNDDKSVENFQSWLLKPMQIFGMCWP